MAIEIERKFLLNGDEWRHQAAGTIYRQGYIPTEDGTTVRIRIAGSSAFLTIKGMSVGLSRPEYEYEIPVDDARHLLDTLCRKPLIEKTRYRIDYHGFIWEIDEFDGVNKGLIIAEIELEQENQSFDKPPWIGKEVTADPRYFNAQLVTHPFSTWKKDG
ncbi:MAG: adenylate cyclase [Desulfobacterales bacterium]|nr:MAG: adenylate cyclase [Desulfobacterales bacterium]